VVPPRYETRADWEILCGLAKQLAIEYLAFNSIEDIWNYQLKGTGVAMEDFEPTGMVPLVD
jgi:thiosulfate reductase/polysulfide reductase chain A